MLYTMFRNATRGKWTHLGVAIDWWMLGIGLMNVLPTIIHGASAKLRLRITKSNVVDARKKARVGLDAIDPDLMMKYGWRTVEGARYTYF